jgi:hypothetical protein
MRIGSIVRRPSRTPPVLPGRLIMRVRARTPARRQRSIRRVLGARAADPLRNAWRIALDHGARRFGCHIARGKTCATRREHYIGSVIVRELYEQRCYALGHVRHYFVGGEREAAITHPARERGATPVVARAGRHAIGDGDHGDAHCVGLQRGCHLRTVPSL